MDRNAVFDGPVRARLDLSECKLKGRMTLLKVHNVAIGVRPPVLIVTATDGLTLPPALLLNISWEICERFRFSRG